MTYYDTQHIQRQLQTSNIHVVISTPFTISIRFITVANIAPGHSLFFITARSKASTSKMKNFSSFLWTLNAALRKRSSIWSWSLLYQIAFLFIILVPSGPPAAPSVKIQDEDRVSLKWTAPNNTGGSEIKGYILEICNQTKICKRKKITKNEAIVKLNEDGRYVFRVAAETAVGLGNWSSQSPPVEWRRGIRGKISDFFHSFSN